MERILFSYHIFIASLIYKKVILFIEPKLVPRIAHSGMLLFAQLDTPSVAVSLEQSSSTSLEESTTPSGVISREPSIVLSDVTNGKPSIFSS